MKYVQRMLAEWRNMVDEREAAGLLGARPQPNREPTASDERRAVRVLLAKLRDAVMELSENESLPPP